MSSDNFTFREATLDDLPLILNWTEQLMDHEALDNSIELQLKPNIAEQLETWLKNLVTDNNSLIIIATDETIKPHLPAGLIIGYLQPQPNEFTLFNMHGIIQMVWVEKDYRNKGIASLLVKHMEDTFQNLDVPYCEIQYSDSNTEAKAFWNKAGYKVVGHHSRKML